MIQKRNKGLLRIVNKWILCLMSLLVYESSWSGQSPSLDLFPWLILFPGYGLRSTVWLGSFVTEFVDYSPWLILFSGYGLKSTVWLGSFMTEFVDYSPWLILFPGYGLRSTVWLGSFVTEFVDYSLW